MSPKSFLHLHWLREAEAGAKKTDVKTPTVKSDTFKEVEVLKLSGKKKQREEVPEGNEPLHETLFWMNI